MQHSASTTGWFASPAGQALAAQAAKVLATLAVVTKASKNTFWSAANLFTIGLVESSV
jgi:hypothetical protein